MKTPPLNKWVFLVGEKDLAKLSMLDCRLVDDLDVLKDLGPHEFLYYVKRV